MWRGWSGVGGGAGGWPWWKMEVRLRGGVAGVKRGAGVVGAENVRAVSWGEMGGVVEG